MQKLFLPLLIAAVILGVIAGNEFFNNSPNANKSGVYIDPPGGDFTLDSNQGKVSLSDYAGKVRLLYFGYTFAPMFALALYNVLRRHLTSSHLKN